MCLTFMFICPAFAITPLPLKKLPALNQALFKQPVPTELLRQTFAQLQTSSQLAALSQAERTLLLTHKFITENNHWPRTVVAVKSQPIAKENYTLPQQQEIALGYMLRTTLENNPHTDPLIRAELEQLKMLYSSQLSTNFMLDQLNAWFSTHSRWPREEIASTKPLTIQEQVEIKLAQYANKICQGRVYAIPPELVEQIRLIRSAYDPSYYPAPANKQEEFYELLTQTQAWLATHHTWPTGSLAYAIESALKGDVNQYPALAELANLKNIYIPLMRLTSLTREEVMPPSRPLTTYSPAEQARLNPSLEPEDDFTVSAQYAQNVRQELIRWLQTYHVWPRVLSGKSLPQYTPLEMESELLAKAVLRLRKAHFVVDDIRTHWINGDLDNDAVIITQLENQTPWHENKNPLLPERFPELNPLVKPDLTALAMYESPDLLLQDLNTWLETHSTWPSAEVTPVTTTPTPQMLLAWRLEAFVLYTCPEHIKRRFWQTSNLWQEILASDVLFRDTTLQKLHLLYRKWH